MEGSRFRTKNEKNVRDSYFFPLWTVRHDGVLYFVQCFPLLIYRESVNEVSLLNAMY